LSVDLLNLSVDLLNNFDFVHRDVIKSDVIHGSIFTYFLFASVLISGHAFSKARLYKIMNELKVSSGHFISDKCLKSVSSK